jgi:hypothetical protein
MTPLVQQRPNLPGRLPVDPRRFQEGELSRLAADQIVQLRFQQTDARGFVLGSRHPALSIHGEAREFEPS